MILSSSSIVYESQVIVETTFFYLFQFNLNGINFHEMDLNLTHSYSISVPYKPLSISIFNKKMFVGTENGSILVIQNEVIINILN